MVDWLFSIVRIAGASFPVASSLVQLQAEIDSKALAKRVRRLEDPVSFLHPDVPEASRELYAALKAQDEAHLQLADDFYSRFRRPLAALESQGYLECRRALNRQLPVGIFLSDPSFIMYLCALCERDDAMEQLIQRADSCPVGEWLEGRQIATEIGLPVQVVAACFAIYESKGYGLCSNTLGAVQYLGKA